MIELDEDQLACKRAVSAWDRDDGKKQIFRVDGYAGTGKTSTIMDTMRELDGLTLYAAFTGKAALVMQQKGCPEASTLHKLIYTPSGMGDKGTVESLEQDLSQARKEILADDENMRSEEVDAHPAVKKILERLEQLKASSQSPIFRLNYDSPLRQADRLVIDECFAKGTLVQTPSGPVPIEAIGSGHSILNAWGIDTVVAVSRKVATSAVQVNIGGVVLTCSESHVFFTGRGEVRADQLGHDDILVQTSQAMRLLREDDTASKKGTDSILLKELRSSLVGAISGVQGSSIHGSLEGPDSKVESYRRPGSVSEDQRHVETNWTQAEDSRGQRNRTDSNTGATYLSTRPGLACGACREYRQSTALLQDRYSQSILDGGSGDRRRQPLHSQSTTGRFAEDGLPGFDRVDSVEILKQGDPRLERFRDADGNIYLYDIQAQRHHSFSVHGWLVHNCSMVGTSLAKDVLSFGIPVLAQGDPGQLPPVADEGYFMQGKPDVFLTKIHRQAAGSPVLMLATRARQGLPLEPGVYGDSRVITASELTPQIALAADQILCGRNKTRHLNNARMRQLKGFSGPRPCPGEKLICLKNNHDKGLLNGSLWTVVKCSDFSRTKLSLTVVPEEGGLPMTFKAHKQFFEGYGDTSYKGWEDRLMEAEKSFYGYEIREAESFTYGYVITVHKSQGSQWNSVLVLDESRAFGQDACKHLYTAVTRAARQVTVRL